MESNFEIARAPIDNNYQTQTHSLFNIDVSNTLGSEYVEMFNDLTRFLIIQISIQFMLCMADPENISMFSGDFIVLMCFVVVGVLFYWLVLRKIVHFK